MKTAQKIALSLLISVVVFGAFSVLAFSGLFDYIETNFFDPRVRQRFEEQLEAAESTVDRHHQATIRSVAAVLDNPAMRRLVRTNQSREDILARQNVIGVLESETAAFSALRVFVDGGEQLIYSTSEEDIRTQDAFRREYRPVSELPQAIRELIPPDPPDAPEIALLPEQNLVVYRLAFLDEFDTPQGTALFSYGTQGIENRLTREGSLVPSDRAVVVRPDAIVLNAPPGQADTLRQAVEEGWQEIASQEWAFPTILLNEELPYVVFSSVTGRGHRLLWLAPEAEFHMTTGMQVVLLASVLLSTFLLVFLLLNLRQDPIVVVSERIKRFQINLLRHYFESNDQVSWEAWQRELANRREELTADIKRGIGRVPKEREPEVDELIDRSWDEIIGVIGSRARIETAPTDLARLESIVQQVVNNLQSLPQGARPAGPAPGAGQPETTAGAQAPPEQAPAAGTPPSAAPPAEAPGPPAEVEPLEAEEVIEEAEPVEEAEDLEEVEALEEAELDAGAPEEAEPVEEAELLEEAEHLEEAEPAEVEEVLEEAEPAGEAEELEEADELEEAEELEAAEADLELAGLVEESAEYAEETDEEALEPLESIDALKEVDALEQEFAGIQEDWETGGSDEVEMGFDSVGDYTGVLEHVEGLEDLGTIGAEEGADEEPSEAELLEPLEEAEEELPSVLEPEEDLEEEEEFEELVEEDEVAGEGELLSTSQGGGFLFQTGLFGLSPPKEEDSGESLEEGIEELSEAGYEGLEEFEEVEELAEEGEAEPLEEPAEIGPPPEEERREAGRATPMSLSVPEGVVNLAELDLASTSHVDVISLRELVASHQTAGEVIRDEDGYYEIDAAAFKQSEDAAPGEMKRLVDSITGGEEAEESRSGIDELLHSRVGLDLFPLSDREGESATPQDQAKEEAYQSRVLLTEQGLDYDRLLLGYKNNDSGIFKSMVTFTRILKSRAAAIFVKKGNSFAAGYSLGIDDSCAEALRIPVDSFLYQEILGRQKAILFRHPLHYFSDFSGVCPDSLFSYIGRVVICPIRFRGEEALLLSSAREGIDSVQAFFDVVGLQAKQTSPA